MIKMTDTEILENAKEKMQRLIESTHIKDSSHTLKVTGVIAQTLKQVTFNDDFIFCR